MSETTKPNLKEVAKYFRDIFNNNSDTSGLEEECKKCKVKNNEKNYILIYAYNGTGKTRLSIEFKNLGKDDKGNRDTLYFNAFTEDLFTWHNDHAEDIDRYLKMDTDSKFIKGLTEFDINSQVGLLLERYADFSFDIIDNQIRFKRNVLIEGKLTTIENIKISRGEERIFIWCVFLTITEIAILQEEPYSWVKYIYIDDPISSLDDNNIIKIASHLAHIIKDKDRRAKIIISSHHPLFFNVMWYELNKKSCRFLLKKDQNDLFVCKNIGDTPYFQHVEVLKQLNDAISSGSLYSYHFNMLRSAMEKMSRFLGYQHFSDCLGEFTDEAEKALHKRMLDVLSHGNHSLFSPVEMKPNEKEDFEKIFRNFIDKFDFNKKYIEK